MKDFKKYLSLINEVKSDNSVNNIIRSLKKQMPDISDELAKTIAFKIQKENEDDVRFEYGQNFHFFREIDPKEKEVFIRETKQHDEPWIYEYSGKVQHGNVIYNYYFEFDGERHGDDIPYRETPHSIQSSIKHKLVEQIPDINNDTANEITEKVYYQIDENKHLEKLRDDSFAFYRKDNDRERFAYNNLIRKQQLDIEKQNLKNREIIKDNGITLNKQTYYFSYVITKQ